MNKVALACIVGMMIYPFIIPRFMNDEFLQGTMIAAKLLSQSGSTSAASHLLLATNSIGTPSWTWQQNVAGLLTFLPGAVFLLSEVSLVTGASPAALAYLPISYFILMVSVYLLARVFYKKAFGVSRSAILVICILSVYSLLSWDVPIENVGFSYLSVAFAEGILALYLIIQSAERRNFKQFLIPLILLFLMITMTHQREPTLILGGLATYGLVALVLKSAPRKFLTQLFWLGITLIVVISFQPFYFSLLGGVSFSRSFESFISYLAGGFTRTIYDLPYSGGAGVPTPSYAAVISKVSGRFFIAAVALITIPFFLSQRLRSIARSNKLSLAYVMVVGASLAYFSFYFLFYQGINFGLIYVWLLTILLVAVVPVFHDFKRFLGKVILVTVIAIVVVLAISNTVFISLYANNSSYSAQPGQQAVGASDFLISHSGDTFEVVGASMQVSSVLLGQMSAYPTQKLQSVVSEVLYSYNIDYQKGGVASAYGNMTAHLNFLIITNYEMHNGIYGDVLPSYLNPSQLGDIVRTLNERQDVLFDSSTSIIYGLS